MPKCTIYIFFLITVSKQELLHHKWSEWNCHILHLHVILSFLCKNRLSETHYTQNPILLCAISTFIDSIYVHSVMVYCLEHHLFTCNLHRWSPSSCCLWTQANSSSVLLKLSVTALCTSERQTNKFTVYSPKCILYNTFYQWCPSDCKPCFRALTITIW